MVYGIKRDTYADYSISKCWLIFSFGGDEYSKQVNKQKRYNPLPIYRGGSSSEKTVNIRRNIPPQNDFIVLQRTAIAIYKAMDINAAMMPA